MFSNDNDPMLATFSNDDNNDVDDTTKTGRKLLTASSLSLSSLLVDSEIPLGNSEAPLSHPPPLTAQIPPEQLKFNKTTNIKPLLKKSKSYGAMPRSVRFKPDDELIQNLIPNRSTPTPTSFDESKQLRDRERLTRRRRTLVSLTLLSLVNLLNYTDRYILGSVLVDVEEFFGVSKSTSGLLHTLFLLSFTLAAPLVGYLGDRSNIKRKYMIIGSSLVWFASVLGASFVESNAFALFLILRCVFGAASAFYECVALPIVSDLFPRDETSRRRAFFLFYLGPPVGVGLGFLTANTTRDLIPDDWRWTMRITPGVLILLTTLTVAFFDEPLRTRSVASSPVSAVSLRPRTTASILVQLASNRTYILVVLACSFSVCSLVGFNWWSPSLIAYMLAAQLFSPDALFQTKQTFSIVQTITGTLGTLFPAEALARLPSSRYPHAAIYLLAAELAASSLALFLFLLFAGSVHIILDIFFYSLFTFFINSWRLLTAGVLIDIVEPDVRSTANSILLFALHLIGDSLAPYWLGAVNDTCFAALSVDSVNSQFYCTQLSLYPLVIIAFLGAAVSLFVNLTFQKDRI